MSWVRHKWEEWHADKLESAKPDSPATKPLSERSRPSPTADQLRAMLAPTWDPTKQWDGSPAMVESPAVVIVRSPRRSEPPLQGVTQPLAEPVKPPARDVTGWAAE